MRLSFFVAVILLRISATASPSVAADHPYYTNVSAENLACLISNSIKKHIKAEGKAWPQKKKEIVARLKSFSSFEEVFNSSSALQAHLTDSGGYLVQDAFMDPALLERLPKENLFGAYLHMLTVFESRRKRFREEEYNFINDPAVLEKAAKYLPMLDKTTTLDVEIPYTKEELEKEYGPLVTVNANGSTETRQISKTSKLFGNQSPVETQKLAVVHIKKMATLASPLFVWLVKQPKESVGHLELFQKASEIYGDPFTALGAIGWISAYEGIGGRRIRGGVGTSRIKPVLQRVSDHTGTIYHFWGYLIRGILGEPDSITWLRLRSRIYEGLIQQDGQDVTVDMFGLRVAEKVLAAIESDEGNCPSSSDLVFGEKKSQVEVNPVKKMMSPRSTQVELPNGPVSSQKVY